MHRSTTALLAAVSAGLIAASTASAAFTTPSWTRPTSTATALASQSTYQSWDVFTDDDLAAGIQDTSPDIGAFNPYGLRSVVTQNGVLLGSGNLYNFTQPIDVAINVPNPGNTDPAAVTRFLLQISTQGNPLISNNDFSKFTLNGVALSTYSPTLQQIVTPAGPQGSIVDNIISFSVPGNASLYTIAYAPIGEGEAGGSVSQRAISVDTNVVVPEPASLAALGAAGLLGLARRRKA